MTYLHVLGNLAITFYTLFYLILTNALIHVSVNDANEITQFFSILRFILRYLIENTFSVPDIEWVF